MAKAQVIGYVSDVKYCWSKENWNGEAILHWIFSHHPITCQIQDWIEFASIFDQQISEELKHLMRFNRLINKKTLQMANMMLFLTRMWLFTKLPYYLSAFRSWSCYFSQLL